jgi:hypothetical protein
MTKPITEPMTDDTPLEVWLFNGTYGTGARRGKEANPFYDKKTKTAAKPFASLAEEMIEFQRIVFAAWGEISGTTDRNNNGMISFYELRLPRWVASSKVEMLFEGTSNGTTMKRIAFFRYQAGNDKAETMSYENRVFGMSEEPGGIAEGVENFFEWVGLTEEKDGRVYIKDVRMTVTYWPDQEGMPGIVQRFSDWSLRSAG